jgi:hypothetical protein
MTDDLDPFAGPVLWAIPSRDLEHRLGDLIRRCVHQRSQDLAQSVIRHLEALCRHLDYGRPDSRGGASALFQVTKPQLGDPGSEAPASGAPGNGMALGLTGRTAKLELSGPALRSGASRRGESAAPVGARPAPVRDRCRLKPRPPVGVGAVRRCR